MIVLAVLIGIGIGHVYWSIVTWPLGDMDVYLGAATRLREGQNLYIPGDVGQNSFWYAPWFAILWIPLTFLPREAVAVGWSLVLLGATTAVAAYLVRSGPSGILLALFATPALVAISAGGNVQALMVLALLLGLFRSWGPLAIAAAASLKYAPILFVLVYVKRREWRRAAITVLLTALLMIPTAAMGLIAAGPRSEAAPSLLGISPVLYLASILLVSGATFVVPVRLAPILAGAAAVLALPRLYVYDVTTEVVAAATEGEGGDARSSREGVSSILHLEPPVQGNLATE